MKKIKALTCIALSFILAFGIFSINSFALDGDIINFPDTNLKSALISNGVDTDEDNEISKSELAAVEGLDLGYLGITDISWLEYATNLIELRLPSNQIVDISALTGLVNLQTLYLNGNNITDIGSLAGLIYLTTLDIGSNSITDISPIAQLVNLTYMDVSSNNISNIDAISQLNHLTVLYLKSNLISDIRPVSNLIMLQYLYVYDNDISDISPLVGLSSLKRLYLNNNNISDIYPLKDISSITYLILDSNNIRDISPLAGLYNLGVLDISNNRLDISEYSPAMEVIDGLKSDYDTSISYLEFQHPTTLAINVMDEYDSAIAIHGSADGNASVIVTDAESVTVTKDGLAYTMPADNVLYLKGLYFITAICGNDQVTFTFTIDKPMPMVTGVVDGKTYLTGRVISFDFGTATIASVLVSGEFGIEASFVNGSMVNVDGKYRLTVTGTTGFQTIVNFCIYRGDYVKGITVATSFDKTIPKTSYADLKARISIESYQTLKVKKAGVEIAPTALIGTGMTIEVSTGETINSTQTIVVMGDVNGDALINVVDLLQIKKQVLTDFLTGAKLVAANIDFDAGNTVGLLDLLRMKKFILSLAAINQY